MRVNRLLLFAVVLGFAGLSLAVTDLHRYLAYDEAIYLSQVYPGPALPFTAPRSRGLPILLAPLGWADAPLPVIRGYLLTVNAGLMYLGFNAWLPVLHRRAVAAAAVFAVAWLPIFYSTEAFPNLPVAFGALAAAGYLARYLTRSTNDDVGSRRALIACGLALAGTALVRPAEASFLTAGLAVVALTPRPRELAVRWAALAIGLLIGWLPWLIEAQVRFGGPAARLRAASANVGGGFHPENLKYHLGYTDGPLGGIVRGGIPRLGELWWLILVIAVLGLLGRVVAGRGGSLERAGVIAAAGGIAAAVEYLFFTQVLEARFLLPAYALLTVAMVAALPRLSGPSAPRLAAAGSALALFAVFAHWQTGVAQRIEVQQVHDRLLAARLADVIRRQGGRPCFVASDLAFPVIAFETGCRGAVFHPDQVSALTTDDPPVYVLTRTDPERTETRAAPGTIRSLAADGAAGWWMFTAATGQEILRSPKSRP